MKYVVLDKVQVKVLAKVLVKVLVKVRYNQFLLIEAYGYVGSLLTVESGNINIQL